MEKLLLEINLPVMSENIRMLIHIAIIFAGGFVLSRILNYVLKRFFDRSKGSGSFDPTSYNFIKNALGFIVLLITFTLIFYQIPGLKGIGNGLLASAGILAAVVGFASQQAFSNIISGIFLVVFKPFRVDDHIKIDDIHTGFVEDITLRHTVIRNSENRRVVIPNAVISNATIINSNIGDPRVCSFVEIGIGYSSSIDKAMEIMRDEALKHKFCIDNRSPEDKRNGEPVVQVRVIALGDFAVTLRAYVWASNHVEATLMKYDLFKSIKERFDREGVEIPYPYRTVVVKNEGRGN